MDKAKKKVSRQDAKADESQANYEYASEAVKDFAYSDYVRVRAGMRGMLFSFGKVHPENDKIVIHSEVLVPLDVTFRLKEIIHDQMSELESQGILQKADESKTDS